MDLHVKFEDAELCENDIKLICERLQLNGNSQFSDILSRLGKAAILEYKGMFIEKGLPKNADVVLQDRLFFLITYYYQDRIPTEQEVYSIFRLDKSQSKNLLRKTLSQFKPKIANQIRNTLINALQSAENGSVNRPVQILTISSDIILEELNAIISQKAPALDKISRKKNSAGEVTCSADTYNFLCQELRIANNPNS